MDTSTRHLVEALREGAISRRQFLTSALALGLSVGAATELLAACGSTGGSSTSPSATTGVPNPNATVRMAYSADDWYIQGAGVKATTYMYQLNVNVYEPLVYLASDYTLKPGLATGWQMMSPTQWRFTLRQGVKFHDGSSFSADDVVWTWAGRQPANKGLLSTVANTLKDVVKVDPYTVDFITTTPNLRLAQQIVHPEGAIVPNGKNFDSSPAVGTGPFRAVDYTPQVGGHFARWDGYWGQKAQVAGIALQFIPDDQARIQALKSGQVDFIIGVPQLSIRPIIQNPQFRIVQSKAGRNQLIYVKKDGLPPNSICADASVRQAVSLAIDRAAYVKTVFDNYADPGRWMSTESILGTYASSVTPVPYNPTKAKQVLDAAGWTVQSDGSRAKGGVTLSLDLIGWAEVTSQAFQFLQSQLQAVGIKCNIFPVADQPSYTAKYTARTFDLDLEVPNQNDDNPAFLPILRMYSQNTGTSQFAPGAAFDALASQAISQATTTPQVQQLAAQMMQELINTDYIVVPLAGLRRIFGMSEKFNLTDPHPSLTNQTWLSLVAYK